MLYLVDTNLLLRSAATESPMYLDAVNAIQSLQRNGHTLHLIEFWSVYTRPIERNGFGRAVAEAKVECDRLQQLFPLLLDTVEVYPRWEDLVVRYGVKGVQVHDTRLVAAMLVHRLTHILTFNVGDFRRYAEITAIAPSAI